MNQILVMSVSRQILSIEDGRDDNLIELVRASGHDRIKRAPASEAVFLFILFSILSYPFLIIKSHQ